MCTDTNGTKRILLNPRGAEFNALRSLLRALLFIACCATTITVRFNERRRERDSRRNYQKDTSETSAERSLAVVPRASSGLLRSPRTTDLEVTFHKTFDFRTRAHESARGSSTGATRDRKRSRERHLKLDSPITESNNAISS